MKKGLFLLLSLCVAMSCVAPNDPLLTIEPAECTVVPSIVEFTAVGEVQSKGPKIALTGYQFSVRRDSDGVSWTFFSEEGKLSFAFEKVDTYVVDVAVADSVGAKNIGSVKSLVTVTDPFASFEWNNTVKQVYKGNPFEFEASNIDAKNYFWQIFKPDPTGPDGYEAQPCWRGEGKKLLCAGLDTVLDGYMVKLTVEDIYGNSRQYTDLVDVLSPLTPTPKGGVYNTLPDGSKGVLISDPTDPKDAYENGTLLFDSSQTLEGIDPVKPLTITKVVWSISIDGVFYQQLVASEKGEIAWTPTKSGRYTISLKVFNNLGESASTNQDLVFEIDKNVPTISSYQLSTAASFGGIFYEGQNMNLTVFASSPSSQNGKITSILWDFENRQVADVTFAPPLEGQTQSFTIPWKIFYSESSQPITYKGKIYVTNEAGWTSDGLPFSILVEDNNPIAQLTLNPKPPIFSGSSIVLSSDGSRTKDGDSSHFSIEMGLYNQLGEKMTLTESNGYTFASGDIQTYTAKLTVTNINGTATEEIPVEVILPRLNPTFLALYNLGCHDYYSGQTIVLDASASKTATLNPIATGDYQWNILFNEAPYTGGTDGNWQNDKIAAHSTLAGNYLLKLDLAGVYKIQLKVRESSSSPWSAVCEEDIFVLENEPINLAIEITGEEDFSDSGVAKTRYSFVGRGSSPDGTELVYKWYNDQIPMGSVAPDAVGSTARFAYRGGSHTVYLVVANGGGSGVAIAISHTFETKDHLPPEAPVVSAVKERVGTGFPVWSWLPTDASDVVGYRVKVDSGNWIETSGTSYTPSEEIIVASGLSKSVTLYVQAKDAFANWSESGFASVVIDKEPPATPIISTDYPNNTTADTTPDFKWEPADPSDADGYRWQVNNEIESGWTETSEKMATVLTALTAGTHQIYVQTKDSCGNWSISAICNLTVDLIPPEIPLVFTSVGYIDDFTNDTTPIWNFKAGNKQDTSEFKHQLVGPSGASEWVFVSVDPAIDVYAFTPTSALTQDGEYTLWVYAKDASGNWSDGAFRTIYLDTVKPEVPVILAETPTQAHSFSFTWNSTDSPYRYRYKTAVGDQWFNHPTSMANSYDVVNAVEGTYYFALQAGDKAGNWSASAEKNVIVDRTPQNPPVVVASFPLLFSGAVPFTWSNADSSDPGVEFRYKVDDSTWTPSSAGYDESWTATFETSVSVPITTEGEHILYVRSKDGVGLWSEAGSAVVVWGKPTVKSDSIVTFPYATNPITIDSLSQVSDVFVIGPIEVTPHVTVVSRSVNPAGIDSRKVRLYSNAISYVLKDGRGSTYSVSGGSAKIDVPPNPKVLNGDFETSSGVDFEAVHWKLHYRGYQVAWSGGWGPFLEQNPASYSGDYQCLIAGVVDCKTYSGPGSFSTNGPNGIPTKALFTPQSCMTHDGTFANSYVTRTMGTAKQANIAIYKDVNYKLRVKTLKCKNANQLWDSKISVEKMAGLVWAEEPIASKDRNKWEEWITQEVSFKATTDGAIEVVLEKTDIDKGSRDNGACYFDEVEIVVTGYPQ